MLCCGGNAALRRLGTLHWGSSTALGQHTVLGKQHDADQARYIVLAARRWAGSVRCDGERHGAGGLCEGDHLGGRNEVGTDMLFEVGCNGSMSKGSFRDQVAGVEWQQKQCK